MISSEHTRCLFWALEATAEQLDVSARAIAERLDELEDLDDDERENALEFFLEARGRALELALERDLAELDAFEAEAGVGGL